MKKCEAKKYLPFVQAMAEGKEVQFRYSASPEQGWFNCNESDDSADWFSKYDLTREFRIKPTPKLRPWKPEEVPMPCLLRPIGYIEHCVWLAMSVSRSGISSVNCHSGGAASISAFDVLLRYNEHSTDGGKTWLPCGVMEE